MIMTVKTMLEKRLVLKLFKEFTKDFNASNIAKEVDKTRVGTYKALNILEKDSIIKGKTLGKARFYKINLKDEYARKNVETLLMEEAKKHKRWIEEFKTLFQYIDILIIFGSIIKNEHKAKDIDLLIVFDKNNNNKINTIIKSKNDVLLKRIHPVKQTRTDLIKNMNNQDKVIINAIKEGIVLYGYEKIVETMRNVRSKE